MLPNTNSTGKLKISSQLQIPEKSTPKNNDNSPCSRNIQPETSKTSASNLDQRDLFDDNSDIIENYANILKRNQIKIQSLSTNDLLQSRTDFNHSNDWNPFVIKKYLSDCSLIEYYKFNASEKNFTKDYITFSCSTLAICGDTIHSSQLPSPQAQSYRQLNSMIFSELDWVKTSNRKVINDCIKRRLMEFIKVINQSALDRNEINSINKIGTDIITKPLKTNYRDFQPEECPTGEIFISIVNCEQSEVKFTKKDKENFVLNWLQTVEPGVVVEPN